MANSQFSQGLIMKYFVLKPAGYDIYAVASRKAMRLYAKLIGKENPTFAKELRAWVRQEEKKQKA